MAVLAVVNSITNIVENIVIAEITDNAPENCYFIDTENYLPVHIGSLWNGTNFEYSDPTQMPEEILQEISINPMCCPD